MVWLGLPFIALGACSDDDDDGPSNPAGKGGSGQSGAAGKSGTGGGAGATGGSAGVNGGSGTGGATAGTGGATAGTGGATAGTGGATGGTGGATAGTGGATGGTGGATAGTGGATGGTGGAGGQGTVRLCNGEPLNPVCCTSDDLCRVDENGCQAIFRCTSLGDGTCDSPPQGGSGYSKGYVPQEPAPGTTCTNEGKVCAYEYRATPGAPAPLEPLVTVCQGGQVKTLSENAKLTCTENDVCAGDGYCSVSFDCCTRYCACVNGQSSCVTECNGEGSGGSCGGG
ncbi:MAG TPA: hypothetical protein VFS00_00535 [Polyangiaceae bacterium]|nr:hypothetical protein [Polyangiaceae bacterium]